MKWTRETANAWQRDYRRRHIGELREYDRMRRSTNMSSRGKDMFCLSRIRAKRRGLDFSLTRDWFEERLVTGVCELTGRKLDVSTGCTTGPRAASPSVDRIDASKGYTPDNCQMILYCLNSAFGNMRVASSQLR